MFNKEMKIIRLDHPLDHLIIISFQMETIREYPATDTEAIHRPHGRKRQKEGIRLVQMYDGSFQLETGNSRTTLVDTKTSHSTTQLKKSPSIKNILKFKKSKSSTTISQTSS